MHVSLLNQRYSLALLLIVLIGRFGCSELDMDGEVTLRLEHSLDMGKSWKDRGSLSFSKARSAIPTVNQVFQCNIKLTISNCLKIFFITYFQFYNYFILNVSTLKAIFKWVYFHLSLLPAYFPCDLIFC